MLDTPVPSQDGSRKLNCIIEGETIIFPVTVGCDWVVGELRKEIRRERALDTLKDAHSLELWKVNIDLKTHDEDSISHLRLEEIGEGVEKLTWRSILEYWPDQPPTTHLHIIVKIPATDDGKGSGEKRLHIADISTDILRHWSKKSKLSLPSISGLPGLLDKPLPHDEKIPLTRIQFDNLLSGVTETKDFCYRDDVERLFRISDAEVSEILHLIFYNAAVQHPPPEDGTEASFHSFWDDNIRKILELLVPSGKSIRDSSRRTSTQKNRPDYGFLKDNVCPFRGEEKTPESRDDPKAELSDKLTWVYSPAPYVFGYYAIGPDLTLTAICAPSTPSQMPVVQDLASANLRFKRDRIANLCRLINLSPYLYPLLKLIGYRDVPEFTVIERDGKSVEIGTKNVKKVYHGDQGAERVRYIQTIYRQLQEKDVPHVDALTHAAHSMIYVEPKGIAVKPSNKKELLDAIICVLRALRVLHRAPPLFHRDIRWPNVLRQADDYTLWFLIDWDDAVGPNNVAANHLCREGHSPRVFMDNHGAEVDIWSVGNLILESTSFTLDNSPELVKLGTWMQNAAPDAQDALIAVEAYAQEKAF